MGMGTGKTIVAFMLCWPRRQAGVDLLPLARGPVGSLSLTATSPSIWSWCRSTWTPAASRTRRNWPRTNAPRGGQTRSVRSGHQLRLRLARPVCDVGEKQRWDLVIADEAHRIKAPSGKASMFFKRLRTKALHRVLLTGTPMPHGPMDIFRADALCGHHHLRPVVLGVPAEVRRNGRLPPQADHRFQKLDDSSV